MSRTSSPTNILYLAFDQRIDNETKTFLQGIYNEYMKGIEDPNSKVGHPDDSGFNLFFPTDIQFNVNTIHYVGLGLNARMTVDGEKTGFDIIPRSSLSKFPLILQNSIGLIDSGYRGEVKAAIRCVNDVNVIFENNISKPKDKDYKLEDGKITVPKGTALVQVVAPNRKPIKVIFVDRLDDETSRGTGGFGSTTPSFTGFSFGAVPNRI